MRVLICTEGRDFQVVTTPFTPEQAAVIATLGVFDDVREYEVDGAVPQGSDFTLLTNEGARKARFIEGQVNETEAAVKAIEVDGFQVCAWGNDECVISTPDALADLLEPV